jgi:ubiquinone biosynthesis protein Coq4
MSIFNPLRTTKALYSLAMLVRDPNRLNQVFEMADALGTPEAMNPIIERLKKSDARIVKAFREKHRIKVDLNVLRRLPEGTLGRVFAEHMIAANLDPSAIPTLEDGDDVMFFRAHLYETHDVWHAVTGFGTDLVGELGLQAFYLAQIPSPLPSLLLAVGFLRSGIYDSELTLSFMDALIRGWRMGRSSIPFFGLRWDEMWSLPLSEVRRRVGIDPSDVSANGVTALAA